MNKNNIELHLYLWLDRRQKYKRDAQASTSQREQSPGLCPMAAMQQPLALLSSSAA
jgi:hypothetical protein